MSVWMDMLADGESDLLDMDQIFAFCEALAKANDMDEWDVKIALMRAMRSGELPLFDADGSPAGIPEELLAEGWLAE